MSEMPAPPVAPRRRAARRVVLLVVAPLLAALAGAVIYLQGGRYVETNNAYVKADKVAVGADVAGLVSAVLVNENQAVAAGQPLLRIDARSFEVAVAKAEAQLAQVRTELAALRASYHAKEAEIALARTRQAFALRDQQRQADLVSRQFISASRFDDARQSTDLAAQQVLALEQDQRRIAEALGGDVGAAIEQHPSYRFARAELERTRLDLSRTELRAPLPGVVSKPPKPGQYLAAGGIALALVASGDLWVEANFPETDLTHVQPGQAVSVHIDTYPRHAWTGTVESLSPATGAEFAVLPAQNATGNWVKIAQRVPVRIRLDPAPEMPPLRSGLSAVVRIDTGHRRRLPGIAP